MYSAAQQKALIPTSSIWLSANAGTGKTQVLTGRVLRLLLEGVSPKKILCVTYTTAASAEMRERISQMIARWAHMDDAELQRKIADILEREPTQKYIQKARSLFAEIVDRPDALSIQTLHGFCQSLLAQFPLEAGISPAFEVLDEEQAKLIRKKVFAETVQLPALKNIIDILAVELTDVQFFGLVEKACKMQRKVLPALANPHNIEPKDFDSMLISHIETVRKNLIYYASVLSNSDGQGDTKTADRLNDFLQLTPDKMARQWQDYAIIYLTEKNEPRKSVLVKKLAQKYPLVEAFARTEQAWILDFIEQRYLEATQIRTAHLSAFLKEFFGLLEHEKTAAQVLEYEDLITKARELLERREASDWVRYKLEGGVQHILLDEAQDTSPEQWAIIEALCTDFFAGVGSTEAERTLFVVGDPKQSIYRFQGAEARLFHGQQTDFQARATSANKAFIPLALQLSYRSAESILRVVDGVLAHENMEKRFGLRVIAPHDLHRKNAAGQVVLLPIIAQEKEEKQEGWILPDNRTPPPDPQRKLVNAICGMVAGWWCEGRILESKGRAVEASDILILVQQRGVLMEQLVRGLKQRGIPVAGVDRLYLTKHIWVQDLLALARFLLLPQDDFSLACALKSPLFAISEDDLFMLAYNRGTHTLWQRVQENHPAIAGVLLEYLNCTDFMPPYELFMHILEAHGGKLKAMARMGEEVKEITHAFLEQTLEYERDHTPSLEGFVQWMSERTVEIKRTPELSGGKLRILTVHGAKGLQAPIVILADAARTANNNSQKAELYFDDTENRIWWLKGDLPNIGKELKEQEKSAEDAESARLLYVAMTRAEDELYVTGWNPMGGNKNNWWAETIEKVMQSENAEEIPAPSAFGGMAKRLYNPQLEIITTTQKIETTETISRPEFLSRPAPQEKIVKAVSVTQSAAIDTAAIARGIEIHRAFEKEDALHPEVMRVMQHPEFALYFNPENSLAEVPIQGNGFSGRIDRLVVLQNEVIIIDFKTAAAIPTVIPKEYQQQMQTYRDLIAPLYPNKTIRLGLLYSAVPKMVWV